MKNNNKLMVNVASGIFVMEGYTNIDNSPFLLLTPFYSIIKFLLPKRHKDQVEKFIEAKKKATLLRADCGKPLPFPDSSIDHIYCSHFLEHLYRDQALKTINYFYKSLKKGGTLYIIVPDIAALVDTYTKHQYGDESADRFIESTTLAWPKRPSFLYRFFSVMGSYGLTHLWMYDKQSLTKIITEAGFTIIPKEEVPTPSISREGVHITAKKI